jgi:hypothetical protein
MKNALTILFIIFSFIIKAQNISSDKNSFNTIIGKIDKHALNCFSEIKRAKIDFKKKETFYYIEPEGYLDINANRHHPFLIELLQKKGINFAHSPEVEFISYYGEKLGEMFPKMSNCYYKTCNELLNQKYGSQFIKNINKTADSLYVISRINDVFEYPSEIDHYYIIYPKAKEFLEQKIEIQKDFFSNFKFPQGFIQSSEKRDFIAKTNFVIKKDSTISDVKIEIEFKNYENNKFSDDIVDQLRTFILNANWRAAVSSGVVVDCRFNINLYN